VVYSEHGQRTLLLLPLGAVMARRQFFVSDLLEQKSRLANQQSLFMPMVGPRAKKTQKDKKFS
jgi:hypothetical protein